MRRRARLQHAGADTSGELAHALRETSLRLRAHLATELVVRTAVDDAHRVLRATSTTLWLTTGEGSPPQLAYATPSPPGAGDPAPSGAVTDAVRRHSTAAPRRGDAPSVAVPLVAPHSGLLGVLEVEGVALGAAEVRFVEDLAQETALALETANLFEQALAAKERSETLLSRVAEAIVVTDARGTIITANDAAGWLLGAHQRNDGTRRTCAALGLHAGERELDCSAGCALLSGTTPDASAAGVEVWRLNGDGRRQPLLASVASVQSADGEISEVVHSFRDITRLKQADEAKTLFLATASHELKTPLTVIRGFSQLLAGARLTNEEERDEAARAIERRALQLTRIVDRLLLSGRIEAGRAEVGVAPIDVAPVLKEQVTSLSRAARREIALTAGGTLEALADLEALRTVIDHLLDNAVKYSPDGGPVDVRASAGDEHVTIVVTDCGIGMDPDQAEHCFDKFWQAESSDVRRFGGTGIGLYIVRSLVEAMGGTIAVATKRGHGSAFTVRLRSASEPRTAPSAALPAEPPAQAPTPAISREPSVIREFMRQLGIPGAPGGGNR